MAGKVFIYGLIDTRPERMGELRYVGQSHVGMHRPLSLHTAKCGSWQKTIQRLGLRDEIWIIEEWDGTGDWKQWLDDTETDYIAYFKGLGCDLTNLTAGGEGLKGPSAETLELMAKVQRDVWKRPGYREMMASKHAGKQQSPEQIAKRVKTFKERGARKGMKHSESAKALIRAARAKQVFSAETREILSQRAKRQWERRREA